jgi:hypothetical protein
MTEPLLIALITCGCALLIEWCRSPRFTAAAGVVLALACLTRYEAWPVTAAALAIAFDVRRRQGNTAQAAAVAAARVAAWPAAAVLAFLVFSRIVIGEWFVAGGFFVPENDALGDPVAALAQVAWGVHQLTGSATGWIAAAGLVAIFGLALFDRSRAPAALALALGAAAALPALAFFEGHPFRIRYMVPLLAVQAVGAGAAAGLFRPAPRAAAAIVAVAALIELRPLDSAAPMVVEAQWDRVNAAARQQVTDCLRAGYDNDTVMASMGSLGHYMQEMSRSGFDLADFLHEGNGDIWLTALLGPRPYAGWVLIEEKAEGGDVLAERVRENPAFLEGFSRTCEGAGVALYRRDAAGRM